VLLRSRYALTARDRYWHARISIARDAWATLFAAVRARHCLALSSFFEHTAPAAPASCSWRIERLSRRLIFLCPLQLQLCRRMARGPARPLTTHHNAARYTHTRMPACIGLEARSRCGILPHGTLSRLLLSTAYNTTHRISPRDCCGCTVTRWRHAPLTQSCASPRTRRCIYSRRRPLRASLSYRATHRTDCLCCTWPRGRDIFSAASYRTLLFA